MMRVWRLSTCLSSVCLTSVAYVGPTSRTDVAHVTRDSNTTFKVKRSKVKVACEAAQLFTIKHTPQCSGPHLTVTQSCQL